MQHIDSPMYIGNLLGSRIVTAEGKRVGHVADVELTPDAPYKIVSLLYGESGLVHRLHLLNPFTKADHSPIEPDRIPWEAIERIEKDTVTLKVGYNKKQGT